MLRVFIGVDPRQPIAYHVLVSSIQRRASGPVSFAPLILSQLPISRRGLTDFTYSRYLVPYLCGYQGKAVFLDSDMLVLGDIYDLVGQQSGDVSIVDFDAGLAFERPSVMVFDCDKCKSLTPEYIDGDSAPQSFDWASEVGTLSPMWNFLVGYGEPTGQELLIHYTQGVPGYKECRDCDYSDEWFDELKVVNHHESWIEIMGSSVHAPHVLRRLSDAHK